MMVVRVAPSHTMRSGARADFGRLFRTTRYGSRISESFLLNHRSTAVRILKTITRRKLTIVSYKVTPRCRKMLRSATMSRKHRAILEGLLKIKESMIWCEAVSSQTDRKTTRRRTRAAATNFLCSRYFDKKVLCALEDEAAVEMALALEVIFVPEAAGISVFDIRFIFI